MDKGSVHIFCGEGKGKTTAVIGQGIRAASQGKSVIVIQFLKGRMVEEIRFLQRLEPEIKLFRFEKSDESFDSLSAEEKEEEAQNIRNGMNFAKKVLVTEGCEVLILDEVLGLIEHGIVTIDDIRTLIEAKDDETELIMTGICNGQELWDCVDEVTQMSTIHKIENNC